MDYDQIITSSLCDAGCMADSFIAKCNNILSERPTVLSKTSSKTRPSSTRTNPSSSAVSKSSLSSSTSTSISPASTPSAASEKSSTPIGAIVGGVLGGLAVLGLIALGALCLLRRKPPPSADPQLAYQTDPLNGLPTDRGVYQPFYELPSDDRSQELPSDDPSKYTSRIPGNGQSSMAQTYHTLPPHLPQNQQYPGTTQPGTVHEIG
ncbi:hypothetical protein GE09DRAFT_1073177 [Coniochaeta sp. 2T2.1]|nr:hypothetical protein GE09DRAFT_1073177 [Coniochaeta sp. 2T2.1]